MYYSKTLWLSLIILLLSSTNINAAEKCYNDTLCVDGVLLPAWKPLIEPGKPDAIIRTVVYLLALLYTFFGVSIIADRFMMAIETITSQEKEVIVKTKTGEEAKVRVRIWNETVSNLTLMALGSSAPEILLSVIEIVGKDFQAGALGPGTIVGSAAFNLFVIVGLCMLVVPNGEIRRIKHLQVFIVTASFSVLAYLWLYIILGVTSPNLIEIWEALVTLLAFPLVVILAYIADRNVFKKGFGNVRYRFGGRRSKHISAFNADDRDAEEFEQMRQQYIRTLQRLRKEHVGAELSTLENMAIAEVFSHQPKSRAYYRVHATRMMTGGANLMNESISKIRSSVLEETLSQDKESVKVQTISFEPCHYTVMEDVGKVKVTVRRQGGNLDAIVSLNYATEDKTAKAGKDYKWCSGVLKFDSYQVENFIEIDIIDDEIFEEDEHFCVALSNLYVENGKEENGYTYQISKTDKATIMILDDDHSGVFYFEKAIFDVDESCGIAYINVQRSTGSRGTVVVPYQTVDGSAKSAADFEEVRGNLVFRNNETVKTIEIRINDDGKYEKNEHFFIKIGEPVLQDRGQRLFKRRGNRPEKVEVEGLPRLGEWCEAKVNIHESTEFKNTIDRLLLKTNASVAMGTSSWKSQFINAVTVPRETDDNGVELPPTLISHILHYLTLFWKLMFALVPPTEYWGGWLCFIVSIIVIGLMTALLGDIASAFGCSIGLLDEVTAITFVAVGTSLPDTFASKVAAVQDPNADSSIGNVTGSNAVNVFLGLGVAWTLAAIVNAVRGKSFVVPVGSLGFSVTIFCCLAVVAIFILMLRRLKCFGGGELGGPTAIKYPCAIIFFTFFLTYVVLSSLQIYCYIPTF